MNHYTEVYMWNWAHRGMFVWRWVPVLPWQLCQSSMLFNTTEVIGCCVHLFQMASSLVVGWSTNNYDCAMFISTTHVFWWNNICHWVTYFEPLCHTIACFEQNLQYQISGEDSVQITTFYGNPVEDTTFLFHGPLWYHNRQWSC